MLVHEGVDHYLLSPGGEDYRTQALAGDRYLHQQSAPVGGRHRDGAAVVRRVAAAARDPASTVRTREYVIETALLSFDASQLPLETLQHSNVIHVHVVQLIYCMWLCLETRRK